MGSSFGCIVVTEFALRHPKEVRGLVLVGPAGFPIEVPTMAKLRDVPLVGDVLFFFFGQNIILEQNRKYFVDKKAPAEFWRFFSTQVEIAGTTEAMARTLKNSPVQSYVPSYEKLGKTGLPVGVIWGTKDATFPYQNNTVLLRVVPQARLVTVDDSAHIPQYERPEIANPAIVEFLAAQR